MKKTFFAIITFSLFASANAQYGKEEATATSPAKSIYFELGPPGLASINYDMRLQKKEDGLGFRVGVGGFSIDGTSAIFIPFGLNYLMGKDQRNYFELGAGATIVSIKERNYFNGTSGSDNFSSSFGHIYMGYRLQPKNGGFTFKAGITPVFGKGFFIPYLPAVAFGYKF